MERDVYCAKLIHRQVKPFKKPLTPWAKDKDLKQAGLLVAIQAETGYHAYLMSLLIRGLGWTSEDADAFCKKAAASHFEKKTGIHGYNILSVIDSSEVSSISTDSVCFSWVVYGRKPFE